jgi:hypothetical protein
MIVAGGHVCFLPVPTITNPLPFHPFTTGFPPLQASQTWGRPDSYSLI